METKKLLIDCVECDVRNITKKLLESYDEIRIDAVKVISSTEANELMAEYPVTIDATDIICLPLDGEVTTINGRKKISGAEIDKPTILAVNGLVEVDNDAEASLKNIISMQINGKLIYPSTLEGKMPPMQINGMTEVYPGDAIRLKKIAEVDELFLLRAKPEKYYAQKCVMILDSGLNLADLDERTTFLTKKAYIAKSLLADAVKHFDDETEIAVVSDGTAWVEETLTLDEDAISRYGTKLLVVGDLRVGENAAEAFEKIEFLHVTGKIVVAESLFDKVLEKKAVCKECIKYKGALLLEKEEVTVDTYFVEKYTNGVALIDCDEVIIEEDVAADWIESKMKIQGCGIVRCSKEQKISVSEIAKDTRISLKKEDDEKEEKQREEKYSDWKIIDTVKYVF